MKRKSLLWSLFLLLFISPEAGAQEGVQEIIYEGYVTYGFDCPDAVSGQVPGFIPDTMTVFFRVDSVKSVEETAGIKVIRIGTPDSLEKYILLETPGERKKLELKQTPGVLEQLHSPEPRLGTFTATGKSKEILGCKATQYQVRDKKSGKEFEAWFTRETILPRNYYTSFFPEKYGTPLEFTLPVNGIPVRITVREFTAEIQDDGVFAPPGDFSPCDYQAFKAVRDSAAR